MLLICFKKLSSSGFADSAGVAGLVVVAGEAVWAAGWGAVVAAAGAGVGAVVAGGAGAAGWASAGLASAGLASAGLASAGAAGAAAAGASSWISALFSGLSGVLSFFGSILAVTG